MPEQAYPTISVIICTRNRAASLALTLDRLADADRHQIRAEIIVVDNGSEDNTRFVVEAFAGSMPVRYLSEPAQGIFGKSHALNRALSAGGLGEIIAILDDDMSPHKDWFERVAEACQRWPQMDIFSGRTCLIFPEGERPGWAQSPRLKSIVFSEQDRVQNESELEPGRWFNGGHFWFRKRVLSNGRRFRDIWLTEPDFQLDLAEEGCRGVFCRQVVAGHRVQPDLFKPEKVLNRIKMLGLALAWLRLDPYRQNVKQARLLHDRPLLGRLFCLTNLVRWQFLYLAANLHLSEANRFARRLIALERRITYLELFRLSNVLPAYSIRRRARRTKEVREIGRSAPA